HTALAAICRGQAEDPGRPDVVRRGGEIYDESRREEIRAFVAGLAALVDEDVGERGGRVADIGRSREGVEDLADAAVDGGRLMLQVRLAIGAEDLFSGINRSMVGFV